MHKNFNFIVLNQRLTLIYDWQQIQSPSKDFTRFDDNYVFNSQSNAEECLVNYCNVRLIINRLVERTDSTKVLTAYSKDYYGQTFIYILRLPNFYYLAVTLNEPNKAKQMTKCMSELADLLLLHFMTPRIEVNYAFNYEKLHADVTEIFRQSAIKITGSELSDTKLMH